MSKILDFVTYFSFPLQKNLAPAKSMKMNGQMIIFYDGNCHFLGTHQ